MSWTLEEMTVCASPDILVIPGDVLGRACRAGLLPMEPSAHLVSADRQSSQAPDHAWTN
ncbi:hypothetical protein ACFVZL_24390 [Streptomyces sp. NPDC058320]|uniref:hypothetical protein n=1 Tax=unclassified Streptomyces TaxID=2593676 RepID=UPI003641E614